MMNKPKLTIQQQIQHMKAKGIIFSSQTDEVKAAHFITEHTYYFKIKAYAKNFPKNNCGKYVNLTFDILKELSTLDMHIRRTILHLCLNLEHAIKVLINQNFCMNSAEDGYSIVQDFILSRDQDHPLSLKKSKYTFGLYDKYKSDFAIWNFMELVTFGDLLSFYLFYFKDEEKKFTKIRHSLFAVQQLRNASAHNNCLLINLVTPQITPTFTIKQLLMGMGISESEANKKLSIVLLNDFANLLHSFNFFVKSKGVRDNTKNELIALLDRISRNIDYFDKHQKLKNNLCFFEKIVDILK